MAMIEFVQQASKFWLEYFSLIVIQNSLFLILVLILLINFRKIPAQIKYFICMIAALKLLIPPFIPYKTSSDLLDTYLLDGNLFPWNSAHTEITVRQMVQNSLPQSSISDSQPDLLSESDTLEDSGFSSEEKAVNTYVPAQKVLLKDKSKDSRQLRYQAAPAPVMSPRAEPLGQSYIESRLKKESKPMEAMTDLAADEAPATLLEKEQLQPSVYRDTNIEGESVPINEPQQWLQTIEQYLQKGQTEQARQLLEQLRKKYPEYPVDPVILQQLSPY